jgi:hypothetical protein
MLFNFVTACGISAALIVFLTAAAYRDRRRGWVRGKQPNFVGDLMADWVTARASVLPDVKVNTIDVQAVAMTGDLLSLDKRLGRVKVRVQKAETKARVTQESAQHVRS